jgi:hypothetical protein
VTQWGLGVVQEIDAAAMSVWLVYRNFSGDVNCSAAFGNCGIGAATNGVLGKNKLDDFDLVKVGALINF